MFFTFFGSGQTMYTSKNLIFFIKKYALREFDVFRNLRGP